MVFVCFDLNGTLVTNPTWLELNAALGVTKEEDATIMRLYREKKLSYREGQKRLEMIYRERGKATRKNIEKILSSYSLRPDARETVSYLQSKNYIVAIISNSIDILVDEVGRDLHIPYAIANNHFIFDDRGQLREIAVSDNDIHFKWKELQQLCKKLFIKPDDCFYIGDGEDDREIFLHIKHGITFRDSSVAPIAWKTIDNFINLKTIL